MTIKQWIIEKTKDALYERKVKLEELEAPKIMITSLEEELLRLSWNELNCGGDVELLEAELTDVEKKTGRGGSIYYTFNGTVNYFPKAKYGRFVARVTK